MLEGAIIIGAIVGLITRVGYSITTPVGEKHYFNSHKMVLLPTTAMKH